MSRDWETYRTALLARGLAILENRPTHHLMNSDLGVFRFLNRAPEFLYRIDLALLTARLLEDNGSNRIVLTRKADPGAPIPPPVSGSSASGRAVRINAALKYAW